VLYSDEVAALFLLTELNTGLTFVRIALTNRKDRDKVVRNQANARLAHDTILRFKLRVPLTPAQQIDFDEKFATLKDGLQQLGETV
jgi:hypothetical protein